MISASTGESLAAMIDLGQVVGAQGVAALLFQDLQHKGFAAAKTSGQADDMHGAGSGITFLDP